MSDAQKAEAISVEEYLNKQQVDEAKHEYVNGQVYAMGGASPNHGRISTNLAIAIGTHLKGSACELFSADLMVKTAVGKYRYPDIVVICDNEFIENGHITQTPKVIIEVLSRSTRRTDEKAKQLEYINIPTLEEYVLVEQDIVDIRVLRRSEGWRATHYFLGESIHLESIDCTIEVAEIYERVDNQDMREFL